jgi:hypothetical protein
VRLSERAFVVEVCGQAVPIFETNFEDFDLVDLRDEEEVVKRLQESFVHVALLDQRTVLFQERAEEQSLQKRKSDFQISFRQIFTFNSCLFTLLVAVGQVKFPNKMSKFNNGIFWVIQWKTEMFWRET